MNRPAPPTVPLVFAHRGASASLPEHTLPAYLRALDEGADGLECDVRMSRDGHLVCLHDRTLNRVSNGRGRVSGYTLAELERLDYGSWHGTGPAPLLTLDRLLAAVTGAGRPVRLLIETKHPSRFGPVVERRLVALLRRHGLARTDPAGPVQVAAMSFSALAVRRLRQLAPGLPTVQLLELLPPGLRLRRLPFGARIAGLSIGLVRSRPELVADLRSGGNQIYVWTVNEPADLALVLRHRVDGVITDRPAAAIAAIGR